MKATTFAVAFSVLRTSNNCATMSAKKERCAMGVDCMTTMKICWLAPLKPELMDGAKAKFKEIVDDPEVLDFLSRAELGWKFVFDKTRISPRENEMVYIANVSTVSRGRGEELLKHKDNLTGGGILVDIRQSDDYGWNYRKVEVNGKAVFEEEWDEYCVNGHNKPSEDFNKTTEDFIIDEFMPDVRIKHDLSQGLPQ